MKKHRGWVRLTGTYPRCFFFVKEMFTNPSLTRRGFRLRHRKCEKSKKKSHESRKPLRRKDFRVHLFYQHMTEKQPHRKDVVVFLSKCIHGRRGLDSACARFSFSAEPSARRKGSAPQSDRKEYGSARLCDSIAGTCACGCRFDENGWKDGGLFWGKR